VRQRVARAALAKLRQRERHLSKLNHQLVLSLRRQQRHTEALSNKRTLLEQELETCRRLLVETAEERDRLKEANNHSRQSHRRKPWRLWPIATIAALVVFGSLLFNRHRRHRGEVFH